ncbi:hypothetical protein EXN00_09795 [Clostridium botulinum]|uniref:hypothetical protein n=1 Tax=Clostridium botulinum TaxID=1491 RepID=UPI000773DB2D|nr:hypothetical protein [Clostridium botulinum]MBN3418596.1 hypothetical protein [Clostridium botulinum]MBN3426106.1 hypothetical protein [Clostridium botulinum]MBN3430433.1 hypothetical protein [Clostridium botulinum]NFC04719.1 hypothetical protein [Clostridium botulinum]NFC12105.1 hypothetical protein [Clostridium botulinum]
MVLAEKKEKQLKHLHNVITDSCYWYSCGFRVMNNEAGSGKSVQTFKSIAELATTTDHKIIYVQMFANKDSEKQDALELKNTVLRINNYANGNRVANYICAENRKEHKKILKESQVICITHKKYLELAKKGGSNFITNSDILIIDEFPNLFESFYISELELTKLQGFTLLSEKDKEDIENLNNFMLNKLNELKDRFGKEMRIVNLHKLDVKKYIKVLNTIIKNAKKDNKVAHKKTIEIAEKVLEILNHSSVYTSIKIGRKNYPVIYSFYNTDYILAQKGNIILDANGGFDMRYKLRADIVEIDKQSKVFNYTDSTINIYPISTTKTALASTQNIIKDVTEYIQEGKHNKKGLLLKKDKHLIVTDIERENLIGNNVKTVLELFSDIYLAHFGALIGKNDWKDYNNIWIVKTPFYSWIDYILQYLFYSKEDLNGNTNCEIKVKKGQYNNYTIFRNKDFNKFKNCIVLGEYYQACKRIARDGRQCNFNILTTEEDIFNLLKQQFKNINEEVKEDLEIKLIEKKENKKTGKEPTKTNTRIKMINNYIQEIKLKGKTKIEKSELVDLLGIKKTKLSPLLKKINNIEIGKGREQEYIRLL